MRDGELAANAAESHDRDDPLELPYEAPTMLFLTREQAHAYLEHAPAAYRPIAEVLLGAGLRIGEPLALEWRDVDRATPALRVERSLKKLRGTDAIQGLGGTKGDRARTVLIDPFLADVLTEHRRSENGLIFPSRTGSALNYDNVRRRGHEVTVEAAGLPPRLRLHDLRHTAATFWLAAGESIFFVKEQLGHADIQTTIDLYGHPDRAAHVEAAKRAAQWRRRPGPPGGTTRPPRRPTQVGETGFEPATARPPAGCATRLRHSPMPCVVQSGRRESNPP